VIYQVLSMKQFKHFTASEWLNHLENRYQQEIQLGLSRIKQVAKILDLLQPKAKIITVAGTNGKGSTVAALEAIYVAAGFQVACYTSPHLLTFNERIRINQQQITDEQLCLAFATIEEHRGQIVLTYFEMATLAALWHFKRHSLDLIILEVGLGGRLDATNIIDTDLAIITTIDFDHQAFLGDTKEAIGYEKAGILRANKPLIFADKNPPASIIRQAFSLNAAMYFFGKEYDYYLQEDSFEFIIQNEVIELPRPSLHCNSVAAALMTSLLLQKDLPIKRDCLTQALKNGFLPGRLQLISGKVVTLLDVAHNPQAVNYLAAYIKNFHCQRRAHAIFSALKDKDIPGLIAPMQDCVKHWYPARLTGKRAASTEQLVAAFSFYGKVPCLHEDPLSAYHNACNQAKEGDLIIVYGSFLTVGRVMPAIYKLPN
jgi:dihydrofolate synthase / folylpolyglutamate synthase